MKHRASLEEKEKVLFLLGVEIKSSDIRFVCISSNNFTYLMYTEHNYTFTTLADFLAGLLFEKWM